MFITLDAFNTILASEPTIILDTCVFLDLLRFSKKSSEELIALYETIFRDFETVPQVKHEFYRSFQKVCGQRTSGIKDARTNIKTALNGCVGSVEKYIYTFQRFKFDFVSDYKNTVKTELEKLKEAIDRQTEKILNEDSFLNENDVIHFFNRIWSKCQQEEYSLDETIEIIKNGEVRFRYKIPPGYKDCVEHGKENSKEGIEAFGDLILWLQIIRLAKTKSNPIIFVTSDVKEDWFLLNNNQPESPREELLVEFRQKTEGREIYILPSERFVEYLSEAKQVDTFEILIEMQSEDFVDQIVTKYRTQIISDFIEWANKDGNIQQFSYQGQVNHLVSIENERFVVKNYSYAIKEHIEYSMLIEGVADFLADWQLDSEHFEKNSQVSKAFRFEIQMTFIRPYRINDLNIKEAAKKIEGLKIVNATLEGIPSHEIDLESRRGVFTLPSEGDKELFKYMDSLWEELEKKDLRHNEAEKTALFETATHFNKTLFEVYRSYFLVGNSKSKREMSLNEIDALASTRFSFMHLAVETGEVVYGERHIPFGDCYPLPDSMKLLPPENGKELDVIFEVNAEYTSMGKIVLHGQTNLPPKTDLMISLRKADSNYNAQSKSTVLPDGFFHSEEFSNAKNPPTYALDHGRYLVEIIMPIFDIQPDDVKVVIGKQSRNLIGEYTFKDGIFGTSVKYEKVIEV